MSSSFHQHQTLSLPAPSNVSVGQLESDRVLIDALPYIDKEYEQPGVRDAALALIEEECRRYRPTKNYLDYLPLEVAAFETAIMRAEFERLSARQPMEMLSMKRYELPTPAAGQKNDITAWNDSVENSLAQLEHMSTRIENLELLEKFGANGWKSHNELLSKMVESAQKHLSNLRREIQETNWQRKSDQMSISVKLQSANDEWNDLVHKNFDIEAACLKLQQEIRILEDEYLQLSAFTSNFSLQNVENVRKRKVLEMHNEQQHTADASRDENADFRSNRGTMFNGSNDYGLRNSADSNGQNSDDENKPPNEKVTKADEES